ncbi:hypothetical protein DUNSADRAFT_18604 [Dunaliella salina]|uniref:Ran guanine nucleotide release factor n=1 Tax=Dunaliella salina TaxID=3046 RepID=A0ABQ7FZT4_DUNSA|nr:hypothetical protein DUNSADRAFT_18604 [Dunaliella salina]|eukprot:KAF5827868.1 hypothetical protein DUNSADRAFT_18604 [Dunaliella salina]
MVLPDQWKRRELFGGAIEMCMPEAYLDMSDIGPVPDNQEVWVDGGNSLIMEIVERSELPEGEVGRFYWQDLASVSESTSTRLDGQEELDVEKELPGIPSSSCPHAYLVNGCQTLTKSRQHPSQAHPVAVWLTILRLPGVQADLLVTANFPCTEADNDRNGSAAGRPMESEGMEGRSQVVKSMLRTLVVRDWSLFG